MYALNSQNNCSDICINKNKDDELGESIYGIICGWEQWGINI